MSRGASASRRSVWNTITCHPFMLPNTSHPDQSSAVSVASPLDSPAGVPSKSKTPLATTSRIHFGTAIPRQGHARAVPALSRTASHAKPAVARPRMRGCHDTCSNAPHLDLFCYNPARCIWRPPNATSVNSQIRLSSLLRSRPRNTENLILPL